MTFGVVLILMMALVFAYKYWSRQKPPYELVASSMIIRELPDGSEVTLEKGSTLEVRDFEHMRLVSLSGKAYFNVSEDKSAAFSVETANSKVLTNGGAFMVAARESKETKIYVESGDVGFYQNPEAFNGSNMRISLAQGEMGQITLGQRGIRKKKVKSKNYIAWKTGSISFMNANMSEVVEVLEDLYALKIFFENKAIRKCILSANYQDKSADEVLTDISQIFNITYNKVGNKVTISGRSCQ